MTVADTVDILIGFIQLAVDEPFGVSLGRVFPNGGGVFHVVFFDVFSRCDKRGSK